MRTTILAMGAMLVLVGCGGSSSSTSTGDTTASGTSGGEAPPPAAPPMPTTTPIPVPQPATPRAQLSQPLQHVWDLTEHAVEVRPPGPPDEATRDAITAWANGAFHDWVVARGDAV